jgi:hypothetical protein
MTSGERLEAAKADLVEFQSRHPRSREGVQEEIQQWLADGRQTTKVDIGGVIVGGGSLHPDHLTAAVRAFVVDSDAFAAWITEQADARDLLPRKKLNTERAKLEKAVREAETAIVREQLQAQRAEAEAKLAELEEQN